MELISILEAMTSAVDFSSRINGSGDFVGTFSIGEAEYKLEALETKIYAADCTLAEITFQRNGTTSRLHTTDVKTSLVVLSTVAKFAAAAVEALHADGILYSADAYDDSRVSLYARLAKKQSGFVDSSALIVRAFKRYETFTPAEFDKARKDQATTAACELFKLIGGELRKGDYVYFLLVKPNSALAKSLNNLSEM